MAIPKRTSGGGKGFLQNEAGALHDYLLHEHPGTSSTTGRPYIRLSVELMIKRDTAVEPLRQFLHAGYLPPGVTVSPDKKTLLGTKQYAIDPATEWGKLVTTLFENPEGVERLRLPEEMYGSGCNYESWMTTRCLFDRVIDKEATERRGPEVNKTTGAKYDRRQLIVVEVLALPAKGKGKKTASPVNGTAKTAAATPTVPAVTDDTDLDGLDRVLIATLANTPNQTINRKGLGTAFLKLSSKLGQTGVARDIPRKVFATDDYLTGAVERGVIDYDGGDDAPITLLAAAG